MILVNFVFILASVSPVSTNSRQFLPIPLPFNQFAPSGRVSMGCGGIAPRQQSSFFRIASKRQKSTNRSTLGGFRSIFGPKIVDFDVILASIFRHIFEHRFCVDFWTFLCDFQKDPILKSSVFTADMSQKTCFCKIKIQHILHQKTCQNNTVF